MPYASISTQFPGGVTNAAPHQTMSEAGTPDPSWSQLYHNEFNTFAASDFTLSGAGTQQAYLLTNSGIGGVLGLVSGPNNNDNAHLFQPVGSFQLTPNKHFFFKARVAVQFNAQQPTVYVGMALNARRRGPFGNRSSTSSGLIVGKRSIRLRLPVSKNPGFGGAESSSIG